MAVIVFILGRVFVAVLFGAAAASKLSARGELVAAVRAFRVVPAAWAAPVAAVVIMAEIAIAVAVVVPGAGRLGLAGAAALLAGFTVVVAATVRRGIATRCRCFGSAARPIGLAHVVRNASATALVIAAAIAAVAAPDRGPAVVELALGALGGGIAAALAIRFDDLVELFGPARITG